ncbi:MAG: di-heme oxidoredictase family protein [Pirellulaceae bacterium]
MRTSLVSLALFAAIVSPLAAAEPATDAVSEGKKLFLREWEAGKPANPGGDGLGPMFNAKSCAACHKLGGIGGAGPNEDSNVRLLTVIPVEQHPSELDGHKATLSKVHPSFVPGGKRLQTAFILHRFGVDNAYASFEKKVMEGYAAGSPEDWAIRISQRNTPPVFGAGLIDAITPEMLRDLVKTQAADGHVTGRVAPGPKGPNGAVLGHFGWRGQTMSLKEFVLGACANELGLEVPGHHQAADPLNPDAKASGLDMSEEQANQLIAYVAALPAPRQETPADPGKAKAAQRGFAAFKTIGCADCHVQDVGPAKGIYSDLLLHDLGPGLGDAVSAVSAKQYLLRREGEIDTYINAGSALKVLQQEWRTPPLWGVRDSGPYLHDGRAKTLKEAILAHAGESILSIEKFAALSEQDQEELIGFLNTLVAP